MAPPATTRSAAEPLRGARGRVRLRTLVLIRWIAIAGQTLTILLVHFGLGYPLPLWSALAIVAVSAALNLSAGLMRPRNRLLRGREAARYLAFDVVQLTALLFLTGGLHNPFAVLILAPVMVSAASLSRKSTITLGALAAAAIGLLAVYHLPLPWPGERFALPAPLIVGSAVALALTVVFAAAYIFTVSESGRRMSDALEATHMALEREQRLSALGALAAAAAHGLGSPLGTIAIVAREIERELPPDSALRPDIELLLSQSERCRVILAELAARPDTGEGGLLSRLPATALIEVAAAPHLSSRVYLAIEAQPAPGADLDQPILPRRAEIVHGLGNLLQNAIQFARAKVEARLSWDAENVSIAIVDDGPGFDPALLGRLGEPYLSGGSQGRGEEEVAMGLGIFIAQTLLEQTGAVVSFGNRPAGGAVVSVTWRRATLVADMEESE